VYGCAVGRACETLHVIGTLNLMEHREAAPVGAAIAWLLVEVEAIGVASPFAEEFEAFGLRVIAPDALLEFEQFLRVGRVRDLGGHVLPCAPLEPPSGPHWSELAYECVSSMPKPVTQTSGSPSGTSSCPCRDRRASRAAGTT